MAATKAATPKKSSGKKGPCWEGYERVPATKQGAKGSCRKKK